MNDAKNTMRQQAEQFAKKCQPEKIRDLFYENSRKPGISKAGVIPYYIQGGKLYYYLMKPIGANPELGDPGFQIGKGSREILIDGEWVNYRPREHKSLASPRTLESLYVNALREGIEEIGLEMANIQAIQEWGVVEFKSERSGNIKTMWLFLAEIENPEHFGEPDEEHGNTESRGWFALGDETDADIRPDHKQVLQTIEPALIRFLNQKYR